MKHNSHFGCLVFLIPITAITLYCLGSVIWMIAYCIIVEGEELFPPTANIGMAFLIFALLLNIPTACLWYIFAFMKRENKELDQLDEFAQESRDLRSSQLQ